MDGVFIINKILDPNLDRQSIENQLDKIKLDAWLELNYDLTSFEKVKILNRIIFDVHKFTGDTALSVLIAITFFTLLAIAAFITFSAP